MSTTISVFFRPDALQIPKTDTRRFLSFLYSGLTAALPCGPSLIGNQDVAHVSSVLTELNLMTYDLHGKHHEYLTHHYHLFYLVTNS